MFDSAKDDEAKKGGSRKEYLGLKVSPHLHNCHGIVESVTYESELLFHLYISFYMASFNRCPISCNNFHVRMGLGLWGTLFQISVYTVFLMFLD